MLRRALLTFVSASVAFALAGCSGTAASPAASPGASAGGASGTGALTVTAVEYQFQNVPDTLAPGTRMTLVNGGRELHELVLFRKNAGVPETFDDILKLPQADITKFVTVVGGLQAAPGATATGTVTADQAGDYALICFIPQGTTALPTGGATLAPGAPHFALGMLRIVTVK